LRVDSVSSLGDVHFETHHGLKSEIAPGPRSSNDGKRGQNDALDIEFEPIALLVIAKIASHAHARFGTGALTS
jgi:hypothetical protein